MGSTWFQGLHPYRSLLHKEKGERGKPSGSPRRLGGPEVMLAAAGPVGLGGVWLAAVVWKISLKRASQGLSAGARMVALKSWMEGVPLSWVVVFCGPGQGRASLPIGPRFIRQFSSLLVASPMSSGALFLPQWEPRRDPARQWPPDVLRAPFFQVSLWEASHPHAQPQCHLTAEAVTACGFRVSDLLCGHLPLPLKRNGKLSLRGCGIISGRRVPLQRSD